MKLTVRNQFRSRIKYKYCATQEALQNCTKHAHAKSIDIQLFKHDSELVITVEDDGIGFDANSTNGGLGLTNMQLRAESMGGMLEISSSAAKGTVVIVSVPLRRY